MSVFVIVFGGQYFRLIDVLLMLLESNSLLYLKVLLIIFRIKTLN
jgi:hypothetical protein